MTDDIVSTNAHRSSHISGLVVLSIVGLRN